MWHVGTNGHKNMELLKQIKVSKKSRPIDGMKIISNKQGKSMWIYGTPPHKPTHIQMINLNSFEVVRELSIDRKKHKVSALEQMPDGKIWMGFSDGHIRLYDPNTLQYMHWSDAFRSEITSLSYAASGDPSSFQAWGSDCHGWVTVWEVKGENQISQVDSSEAHMATRVTLLTPCSLRPEFCSDSDVEQNEPNEGGTEVVADMFSDWKELFSTTQSSTSIREEDLSPRNSIDDQLLEDSMHVEQAVDAKREMEAEGQIFLFSGDYTGRVIIWDCSVSKLSFILIF